MQVVVSTGGKFHHFDLARQLHRHDMLRCIFTGYPRQKLKSENLPDAKIRSYSAGLIASMLARRVSGPLSPLGKQFAWMNYQGFDARVARNLPDCDALVVSSGSGYMSGLAAKKRGAIYICDRGAAHIRLQDELIGGEFRRFGQKYPSIDERKMRKEEREYELADMIFVPSQFAYEGFVGRGISPDKLRLIPLGVDLKRFSKVAEPEPDVFDVLYVGALSLQKGIPYLIEAFEQLNAKNKRLTLVGAPQPEIGSIIKDALTRTPIHIPGIIPRSELKAIMSRSHVMVLPSVQDGFGMVMAEALACGCPVIASKNTGGRDLFQDGIEGYIVEPRNSEMIADRLQLLADNPDLRERMSRAALERVSTIGGWDSYGDNVVDAIRQYRQAH